MQRFAHELAAALPWLSRGRHIGNVCALLERCYIDPEGWTVRALLDVINRHNASAGVFTRPFQEQRDPIAYLSWQIRSAVDPAAPTPLEEESRRAEERAERRAQQQREREVEAARIAAIDQEEIVRIIAASNAEIAAKNRNRKGPGSY